MNPNYRRLERLNIPWATLCPGDSLTAQSAGFMALHLDVLEHTGKTYVIALAHYGKQNGDLMADPDMTVLVDHACCSVQALSFQNDYLGMYTETEVGILRLSLEEFLAEWLVNLASQGFTFTETTIEAA